MRRGEIRPIVTPCTGPSERNTAGAGGGVGGKEPGADPGRIGWASGADLSGPDDVVPGADERPFTGPGFWAGRHRSGRSGTGRGGPFFSAPISRSGLGAEDQPRPLTTIRRKRQGHSGPGPAPRGGRHDRPRHPGPDGLAEHVAQLKARGDPALLARGGAIQRGHRKGRRPGPCRRRPPPTPGPRARRAPTAAARRPSGRGRPARSPA